MPHFRMCSSGKIFAEKVSMLFVMVNKWDLSCLSTKMGNENSRNDFKMVTFIHLLMQNSASIMGSGTFLHQKSIFDFFTVALL